MTCNKLIKPIICIAFILTGLKASAQIDILQNSLNKLESYKNYSYQSVNDKKEIFATDTVRKQIKATITPKSGDENFGYLFYIETLNVNDKSYTDLYNGQTLIHTITADSTYKMTNIKSFGSQETLPGFLKWVQGRIKNNSAKVVKTNDTTINGADSYHLIIKVYDTIINKQHNYTTVHLCIDKSSGLPDCSIIKSRNTEYGNGVTYFYSKTNYSDYKFNQPNVDIASITIPKGFHLPKENPKKETVLLAPGTIAPDWTLYDCNGKKTSLAQMKGKVIIIDFFFIGCSGCMQSLKSLDKLHEKYKSKNFELLSISLRDSKKSIISFKKNYHIKYLIYPEGGNVAESYHATAFPTFYIIDQEGKIANVTEGYNTDNFEKKMDDIISGLLKKS